LRNNFTHLALSHDDVLC